MKKYALVLLIIPFLISCNQQKVKQLELKNDSLVSQANLKDESINEFLMAFNDIQYNLDSIKEKEMIISERTEGKTEFKKKAKDQITNDINTIYNLLTDTKDKLADLRKKLGKSNYQVKELEKMMDLMSKQIEAKDQEIEILTTELEVLNIQVTDLTNDVSDLKLETAEQKAIIQDKNDEIAKKTKELNTAYYVVGTKKELKENNITTAEGGFIGIGKGKKLKADFDTDYFTKIDIRSTNKIAIPGKKVNVITSHPTESYTITGEGDDRMLEITNSEEFWKSSKYLVVRND